jgi:endoglucanase
MTTVPGDIRLRSRFRTGTVLSVGVWLLASACSATSEEPETVAQIESSVTWSSTKSILVNQIGYLPGATKVAVVLSSSTTPLSFEVVNASGTRVFGPANTVVKGADAPSGESVHHADFSAFGTAGTGYKVRIAATGAESEGFDVSTNLYGAVNLPKAALKYFYQHRQGQSLATTSYMTDFASAAHAHAGLHLGDDVLKAYNNWTTATFNVKGGWSDAGDFGKYADSQAISAWLLLNLFERFKTKGLDTLALNLPESGNSTPDLVDEVKWGTLFMRGLMPNPLSSPALTSTNLAAHKCHNTSWSAFPTTISTENTTYGPTKNNRYCMGPSTSATYAVARSLAHLARVLKPYDSATADDYYQVAKEAYRRAKGTPVKSFDTAQSPGSGVGGGDYLDPVVSDDQYAAATELYLTAYARSDTAAVTAYKADVTGSARYKNVGYFDWGEFDGYEATPGTLSLLTAANDLPAADISAMKTNVTTYANSIKAAVEGQGFPSAVSSSSAYVWGSNKSQVYGALVLVYAYEISGNTSYLKTAYRVMDYLFGTNSLRLSFVTGFGDTPERDTHDRWAWQNYPATPYPKGWLSGGPNSVNVNDPATPTSGPNAKRYAIGETAPNAWASKENTIDWNAGLAWAAYALDYYDTALASPPAAGSCTDGVKNGSESDVDCGGSCSAKCANGKTCGGNTDCTSNGCVNGTCQTPTCTDGVQDGTETGKDCGGSCAACPSCTDGVKNGSETDVDCGGSCSADCANGKLCASGADCQSANCVSGTCQAATTPCAGLCTGAVSFAGPSFSSGNLGTGAVCRETLASLNGGNCGNMGSRVFKVNGVTQSCSGNWAALPAKRNGGYCLQATAGDPAWAYFTTW